MVCVDNLATAHTQQRYMTFIIYSIDIRGKHFGNERRWKHDRKTHRPQLL